MRAMDDRCRWARSRDHDRESAGTSHDTGFLKPFRLLADGRGCEPGLDVLNGADDLVQRGHPMFPVHVHDRAQQLQVDCREWREGLDDPVDVRLVLVEERPGRAP